MSDRALALRTLVIAVAIMISYNRSFAISSCTRSLIVWDPLTTLIPQVMGIGIGADYPLSACITSESVLVA